MRSDPPLLLAFDTSAAHCAAALVQGDRIRATRREAMARGQAERLLTMLEEVLAEGGASWADLDALAVGVGPGNFTGLRIAVAAARGLALALGVPAIGVNRFEALAFGHPGAVLVTLEDPRGGLFTQGFEDGAARELTPGPGVLCLGFQAGELARAAGAIAGPEDTGVDPIPIARVAATRIGDDTRPAPLYLRRADAAPASEPETMILDDA